MASDSLRSCIDAGVCRARPGSPWQSRRAGENSDTDSSAAHRTSRSLRRARRDVSVANELANHGAVLAFHQRVVLTAARPTLGELRMQLFHHFRHSMIDVLRAVVDVKPQYHRSEER